VIEYEQENTHARHACVYCVFSRDLSRDLWRSGISTSSNVRWLSGRTSRDTRGRFKVVSIKGDILLTWRLTPQLIFSSTPLRAPEPMLVFWWRPARVPAIRFLWSVLATARHCFLYSNFVHAYINYIYIVLDFQPSSTSCVLHCKYTVCISSCTFHDGCLDLFLFCILACVVFVDPSCIFGVLVYLFLFASSFSRIKLILDHVNFVTEIRTRYWVKKIHLSGPCWLLVLSYRSSPRSV
jgi:hypothetical protein